MTSFDRSPPAPGSALARLAEALGIGLEYWDASGRHYAVGAGTIRALAAGFGWPAADDAAAEAALAGLTERRSRRVLDPVSVVAPGEGSVVVEARFAVASVGNGFDWRLELEDGAVRKGHAHPAYLAVGSPGQTDGGDLLSIRLDLGSGVPPGYHRLVLSGPALAGREGREQTVIVAPTRCYVPPAWEAGGRIWGIAAEPYALRSGHDWGIGDFSALADLVRAAGHLGAGSVGLTPLHALFPARPRQDSPYYASSRTFLNTLYIDVEAVPDLADCPEERERLASPEFQAARESLARRELIDYEGVARLKVDSLRVLHAAFRRRHPPGRAKGRGAAFAAFVAKGGPALAAQAAFDALSEAYGPNWREWPADCGRPDGAGVAAFCAGHAAAVDFRLYLQWEADRQLAAAAEAGRTAGLAAGLYLDVALAAAPDGAEAWINQDALMFGAEIGAPPDAFNPGGQGWGLPPFDPHALRRAAYAPFIAVLRAAMRHAGVVRLDHVMGLARQFWMPAGHAPVDGTYVRFPLDELIGVVALESERNRCAVIGEDLGTVPEGFRERIAAARVLSYRLLYFEQGWGGGFKPPHDYPALALATVTTHDLPTLPGFFAGHDIEVRGRLGLFPSPDIEAASRRDRDHAKWALMEALRAHGGLAGDNPSADDLLMAAYRFLARAPSHLLTVRAEDVLGLLDQTNLPGTVDQHPNWKRRLPVSVAELAADPRLGRLAAMLANEGRAVR